MPLPLLFQRVRHRLRKDWVRWREKSDYIRETYSTQTHRLRSFLPVGSVTLTDNQVQTYRLLCQPILNHCLDILGSGTRSVSYGESCEGFAGHRYEAEAIESDADGMWLSGLVNASNLKRAQSVWTHVDTKYVPIDWQRDFRSGYRWSAKTHHSSIRYGEVAGADVKVPWELARMQHLPALALAFAGDMAHEELYREFCDQVLDFIATNPPRFGVNWTLPMDVAIRGVNWVLANDLFCSFGARRNTDFENILASSLYDHALYIADHLEWNAVLRGNHYLANVAGLLWISTYLEGGSSLRHWHTFARRELLREIDSQFFEEGSNFEGSIPYHRLSAEIAAYSVALLLADEASQHEHLGSALTRMQRAAAFSRFVTHPNGAAAQFGDNDSGRFLRLEEVPADALDHAPLKEMMKGFRREGHSATAQVIRALVKDQISAADVEPFRAYPQFGVYRLENARFVALIRYGPVGQHGYGGHAHNDQGSFELSIDGELFVVDPGTFIYSADVSARNHFRSTAMQNTLSVEGMEQNDWLAGREGLFFLLGDRTQGRVCEHSATSLVGEHLGFGEVHRRRLVLQGDSLSFSDHCSVPGKKTVCLHLHPDVSVEEETGTILLSRGSTKARVSAVDASWSVSDSQYSPEYGRVVPNKKLELAMSGDEIFWSIEVTP
jgi:hypothetical protein